MRSARKQSVTFPAWVALMLFVLALVGASHGQDILPAWAPQPYIEGGLSLMPGGYSSVAFRVQGGLYENWKHIVADVYVARDNGKKTNDGTLNNITGHDNYASAFIAYRPKTNTYYGFGPRWSELVTTNYTKGTNIFQAVRDGDFRVQAVAGHDWYRPTFNMRGQVNYIFPPFHESVAYPSATVSGKTFVCQGCGNGLQGPEFHLYMPSPEYSKHFYAEFVYGIYEFHTTVTEPCPGPLCNPADFEAQRNSRHVTETVDFKIAYRF